MPLVFLIGFMGSGKTTFGKKLSNKLHTEFIDIDEVVMRQHHVSGIKELVDLKGMDFFRQAETDALKSVAIYDAVISTGGGTPCYADNLNWMKRRGVVVFLNVEEGIIFSRLKTTDLKERPLLKDLNDSGLKLFIHDTLEERMPYYSQAQITFDPINQKMDELVAILKAM